MRWQRELCRWILAAAFLCGGAYAQPGLPGAGTAQESEVEEEMTCGLTRANIPLGLSAAQATALVLQMSPPRNRLDFELLEGIVWRYGLTEPYEKVAGWLDEAKTLQHRLQLFSTLALLSAGDFRGPEAERFQATLAEVRSSFEWQQVFHILGRLDTARFDQPALDQLRRVIVSLGTSDEDYSIRIERLNLEALHSSQEFRLLSARKIMRETLALPRPQRVAATIDRYADLDGGFSEILKPWAATRLVRETWGAEPPGQTRRDPQPPLVQDVAQALRDGIRRAVAAGADLSEEEQQGARLRLLRALRHIGAQVSPDEQRFVQEHNELQTDLLD